MSMDAVVVGVVVAVAAVWAVRGTVRATRRKQVCSTCGSSGACPLVKGANAADAPGVPCGLEGSPPGDEPTGRR